MSGTSKSGGVAIGTSVTGGNVRFHEPFTDRQIGPKGGDFLDHRDTLFRP